MYSKCLWRFVVLISTACVALSADVLPAPMDFMHVLQPLHGRQHQHGKQLQETPDWQPHITMAAANAVCGLKIFTVGNAVLLSSLRQHAAETRSREQVCQLPSSFQFVYTAIAHDSHTVVSLSNSPSSAIPVRCRRSWIMAIRWPVESCPSSPPWLQGPNNP